MDSRDWNCSRGVDLFSDVSEVNEQTKISHQQLEIAKGERAELLKPQLVVEITNVILADGKDGPTANVTFTIRNLVAVCSG